MKLVWAGTIVVASIVAGSVLPGPFHKARETSGGTPILTDSTANPATVEIVGRACSNCHSNETTWPWYSHVAPASWLLERDVLHGRKFMNLSLWPDYGAEGQAQLASEAAKQIRSGAMPPSRYLALHPEARLTPVEKQTLANWFEQESGRLLGVQK